MRFYQLLVLQTSIIFARCHGVDEERGNDARELSLFHASSRVDASRNTLDPSSPTKKMSRTSTLADSIRNPMPDKMISLTSARAETTSDPQPPNLLFIMADQLRYDAIQFVQEQMPIYNNKLKVRTPNIDRIVKEGVFFQNAYSQASSCGPARATLRTGNTVERHGVQDNRLLSKQTYWNSTTSTLPPKWKREFERKISSVHTYDQILAAVDYDVESYGKWHMPRAWYNKSDGSGNAVIYDTYAINFAYPEARQSMLTSNQYREQVRVWTKRAGLVKSFSASTAKSPRSEWPYKPLSLDPRNSPLKPRQVNKLGESSAIGVDSLPDNFSTSAYVGSQALLAIERLSTSSKPWALTVGFENPHPPYIAPKEYAGYYLSQKYELLLPPNMNSKLGNDDYAKEQAKYKKQGFRNDAKIRGLTAVYYAMIEQVDAWIGKLLNELDRQGLANNTMIVFTSDHGELLGAHGLQGKIGMLEEAIRVPLFMKLPGRIAEGTTVQRPVSHLDVFSTIMDYLGQTKWDKSDGKSLRPLISKTSFRRFYDDAAVISEEDSRMPINNRKLTGSLASSPNFMIRHGPWKLFIAKKASTETQDLMFNLASDPYEKRDLLGKKMNVHLIGKAEHLKCLLVEWLRRNDGGNQRYYSNPKWNGYEGRGDMIEVIRRRTWRTVDQWVSDVKLKLDPPVFYNGKWRSNGWLYIGRTNPGKLKVKHVEVKGLAKRYFTVSRKAGIVGQNGHMRIKIAFKSSEVLDPKELDARVVISSSEDSHRVIPIFFAVNA